MMAKHDQNKYIQLQNWLIILLNTYAEHPSNGLAKVICYYVDRITHNDDVCASRDLSCQYQQMQKFWHWRAAQHN